MNKDSKLPELLTLSKTAEILSVHPNTLRKWEKQGLLVPIRIGTRKDRRYKKEDLLKLMESN